MCLLAFSYFLPLGHGIDDFQPKTKILGPKILPGDTSRGLGSANLVYKGFLHTLN